MINTNLNSLEREWQEYRVHDMERSYEKLLNIENDLRNARRIPAGEVSKELLRELDKIIVEFQACVIDAQELQEELKNRMER